MCIQIVLLSQIFSVNHLFTYIFKNETFMNQSDSVLELISMFWPADTFPVVNSMLEGLIISE